ncbi:MAG: hypothetical protein P8179_06470 [Candidatus Thiodiazotropha sp.]
MKELEVAPFLPMLGYSKELQRRHALPQACHSRCSVIHPVGDHNHRSYFLQN